VPQYANFQVDPRLATLLGEYYRSSEAALKELVDNAWDADADTVRIDLPKAMTSDPIIISDDGSGMTPQEVTSEYLVVASDRRTRKGEVTPGKKRKVKGRKGIGKFAGLMAADLMEVETRARGNRTTLSISKADLINAKRDLEKFDIPVDIVKEDSDRHGTTIGLKSLNQQLAFPDPDKLKHLLILEYGREKDFTIYVDGAALAIDDIPGHGVTEERTLEGVGPVKLQLKVIDGKQSVKQAGVIIRVGGKIVGRPSSFGLDDAEDIPKKLLKRIYGEIEADGLADHVTADGAAVIENSKPFEKVTELVQQTIRRELEAVYKNEMTLAKARLQAEINRRLADVPEHRREFARKAMERVMQRFYGESEERITPIVSVMLDGLEKDEYWFVLKRIDEAKDADVETFAGALAAFGLLEISIMAEQSARRMRFLDDVDELIANPKTLESTMHKALEKNLWVLGVKYSLMSSNQTLARIVEENIGKKFTGARANKRPDLFLAQNIYGQHLLVEFKRPNHTITRDDENQAEKYRDDLSAHFKDIDIIVLGSKRDAKIATAYNSRSIQLISYADMISQARTELSALVQQLQTESLETAVGSS
jgi:hypothetical protein